MTVILLFCTSPDVTGDTVKDLNEAYRQSEADAQGEAILYNPFTPALSDASTILRPSQTPVDFVVETFSDKTDAQLREVGQQLAHAARNHKGRIYLVNVPLAILDKRSVRDKTVVFQTCYQPSENELDHTVKWDSWRVSWTDAYLTSVQLQFTQEVLYEVFLKKKAQFTNTDGVFLASEAMRACGYLTR